MFNIHTMKCSYSIFLWNLSIVYFFASLQLLSIDVPGSKTQNEKA